MPSFGMPNTDQMVEIARELFSVFDLPYDLLNEPVPNLTNEQRHLIALIRAFSHPFKLLLLDDVLPNLSYQRQIILLDFIRKYAEQGRGVIICSENLNHLFNVTNRICVLFESRLVADLKTSECTPRDVVEFTIGASNPEQVTPVIWAMENYQRAEKQTEALFQKQIEMHESLEARDQLNRQLVLKLSDQVKAMNRLNSALQEAQRRLMSQREEERKALARELHDSIIQDLISLNYRLESLEGPGPNEDQNDELVAIQREIRQVVSDLRQVCRDLRPPTIDNHGLSSAIPSLVQEWEERTGIKVKISIDRKMGRLPEWIELSIFRIIQEGLNNVAKHAGASQVQMTLAKTPAGELLIKIADDGHGIENIPDLADLSTQKHFGLIGISERIALLDGSMQIDSAVNGGFALEVNLPIPNPFE
ncbi:MAG: ABC transporter [Aliifodinibius sp.]|nr:ABC transporter [Fodinibius sp.]